MSRLDEYDDIQNPLLEKTKLNEKGKAILELENNYINNYLEKDVSLDRS